MVHNDDQVTMSHHPGGITMNIWRITKETTTLKGLTWIRTQRAAAFAGARDKLIIPARNSFGTYL